MSQFIKFYFTSVLNMFRTLIHSSLGACYFYIVSPHWLGVGDKIEKSQAPADGCINVRNMLST